MSSFKGSLKKQLKTENTQKTINQKEKMMAHMVDLNEKQTASEFSVIFHKKIRLRFFILDCVSFLASLVYKVFCEL